MLTLESFFETSDGFKVFRDHSDPNVLYYLPKPTIRVARNGDGLHFVAYTEDVATDPDFTLSEERSGGFLTLEVELVHPTSPIVPPDGIIGLLFGTPKVAPVPFIGGSCELMMLGSKGSAGGTSDGFQVTIVGSTAPVLDRPNNAVFSVRVGGKAAEILWNTLGGRGATTRDAQAAVVYSMDYLALRPAYHLKIEIDFKYSFEYWRHRVGVNAVAVQADLDFMIQTAVNEGKIIIHEENFQEGNSDSLIGGSNLMTLVRDLMSESLFHPAPVPTPDYRALPDSATNAMTGAGGLSTIGRIAGDPAGTTTGAATGATGAPASTTPATATTTTPVVTGTFIKLTHTPPARGTPGAATPIAVTVEVTSPGRMSAITLKWRRAGTGAFADAPLTGPAAVDGVLPAGTYRGELVGQTEGTEVEYFVEATGRAAAEGTDGPIRLPTAGGDAPLRFRTTTSTSAVEAGTAQSAGTFIKVKHTPLPALQLQDREVRVNAKLEVTGTPFISSLELKWRRRTATSFTTVNFMEGQTRPTTGFAAGDYHAAIPGQPEGTEVEYFLVAKGRETASAAETTDATINLPNDGEAAPYTFRAVSQQELERATTNDRNTAAHPIPSNASAGIGYSLRNISASEQIKRTFDLTRTTATRQTYRAAGTISGSNIGASFDPATHVSVIQLGQGPFKLIQLEAGANFDFAAARIKSVKVHIDYPSSAAVERTADILLDAAHPTGKVQFMANVAGAQTYDYRVEMVYDPEAVVGQIPATMPWPTFTGQTDRHLMINLDQHSALLPVKIETGLLSFSDTTLRQVQVRVAPSAGAADASTIKLDATHGGELRYVVPDNFSAPRYHMKQTFLFRDDQAEFELADQRATHVVVNEPPDLIYRMRPRLVDPTGLVQEVLLDATYTHTGGAEEQAVLHLTPAGPTSELTVLRAPTDPRTWSGRPRFILAGRDPVESPTVLTFLSPEPLIGLSQAGLRVVHVELLEDPSIFTGDLRAIRVILGADVNDGSLPTVSVTLRAATVSGVAIVPGVASAAPVSVAVEVLRSGAAPTRTVHTLAASDKTFFVLL